MNSSKENVQHFLLAKGYKKKIIAMFINYDGQDLLAASLESLTRKCGVDEGERLKGTLDSIKLSLLALIEGKVYH